MACEPGEIRMNDHSETTDDDGEYVIETAGFAQDAVVPIVCLVLFGLILLSGPVLVATGHWNLPQSYSEGPDLRDPGIRRASALGGILLLGFAARLAYQGCVYCAKPFVFDRWTDELRLGVKPLCRLSDIRLVQVMEQRVEEDSTFQLSLILANARRIGFGPFLRFSRVGAETRKAQIEAFLSLPPLDLPKPTAPQPVVGVWDRELDQG
jgi:hypothetical protein